MASLERKFHAAWLGAPPRTRPTRQDVSRPFGNRLRIMHQLYAAAKHVPNGAAVRGKMRRCLWSVVADPRPERVAPDFVADAWARTRQQKRCRAAGHEQRAPKIARNDGP